MTNVKKIDINKLAADFADFERIHAGDDFTHCETIEQIEFPKLPRKEVATLCRTDRTKSICRDASELGYWSNAGVSFLVREGCEDIIPPVGSFRYRRTANIDSTLKEAEISCRELKVKIVAQSRDEIMFANGGDRIVIQKRFLLLIKKYGVGSIASFTSNREFTCIAVRDAEGKSLGLVMSLNRKNNPGWVKAIIKDRQETFGDSFVESNKASVIFDKPKTSGGKRVMRIRFVSEDGMMTLFEATKKEYGDWRLQHEGTMSVSFDNLRKLKKFCETMVNYMHVGSTGFVEFRRIGE